MEEIKSLTFTYKNWKGEVSQRNAIPLRIWFGKTEYHPEPQWLMKAHDTEKKAIRDFSLNDIIEWGETNKLNKVENSRQNSSVSIFTIDNVTYCTWLDKESRLKIAFKSKDKEGGVIWSEAKDCIEFTSEYEPYAELSEEERLYLKLKMDNRQPKFTVDIDYIIDEIKLKKEKDSHRITRELEIVSKLINSGEINPYSEMVKEAEETLNFFDDYLKSTGRDKQQMMYNNKKLYCIYLSKSPLNMFEMTLATSENYITWKREKVTSHSQMEFTKENKETKQPEAKLSFWGKIKSMFRRIS